ncbi:MAG: RNA-binding protein [Nitrospira sp.]|nr:RNA-binding protein [Nitrospira sp.]HNP28655.1 RNA-binding protein [Nitrospirales bacterium]
MNSKIFVGGLPYAMTDTQLQELFSPYGVVKSAQVILDKMTGRSRGFGFVEMSKAEEAQAAIAAWNDKIYEGRTLMVNEAQPRVARRSNEPTPSWERR